MTVHLRRTLFVVTTGLLLGAPLRLAAADAGVESQVPIDPDLPKPGPVIVEKFGSWTPVLIDPHPLLIAEAPAAPADAAPAPIDTPQPSTPD